MTRINRGVLFVLAASLGGLIVAADAYPMIAVVIGIAIYFGITDEISV
jgi:hypothetical protein